MSSGSVSSLLASRIQVCKTWSPSWIEVEVRFSWVVWALSVAQTKNYTHRASAKIVSSNLIASLPVDSIRLDSASQI